MGKLDYLVRAVFWAVVFLTVSTGGLQWSYDYNNRHHGSKPVVHISSTATVDKFEVRTFRGDYTGFTQLVVSLQSKKKTIIYLRNNGGGRVDNAVYLKRAVEMSPGRVEVITDGFAASAAFDFAFAGKPSIIRYNAKLWQHAVSNGSKTNARMTRWTSRYFTPGFFSPQEVEWMIRMGNKYWLKFTGREACERLKSKKLARVIMRDTYCSLRY